MSEKKQEIDVDFTIDQWISDEGTVRQGKRSGKIFKVIPDSKRSYLYSILIQIFIQDYGFTREDFKTYDVKNRVVNKIAFDAGSASDLTRSKARCSKDWDMAIAEAYPRTKDIDRSMIKQPDVSQVNVNVEVDKPKESIEKNVSQELKNVHKPDPTINLNDFPFDFNAPCHVIDRPEYDRSKHDQGLKVVSNVQWNMKLLAELEDGDDNESK